MSPTPSSLVSAGSRLMCHWAPAAIPAAARQRPRYGIDRLLYAYQDGRRSPIPSLTAFVDGAGSCLLADNVVDAPAPAVTNFLARVRAPHVLARSTTLPTATSRPRSGRRRPGRPHPLESRRPPTLLARHLLLTTSLFEVSRPSTAAGGADITASTPVRRAAPMIRLLDAPGATPSRRRLLRGQRLRPRPGGNKAEVRIVVTRYVR